MNSITTIKDLIEEFDNADSSKRMSVLKSIEIPIKEFRQFASWKERGYTRNCITKRNGFEFILLCWDSKSKTGIHDHDGQECWVYQVDGCVREVRFKEKGSELEKVNEMELEEGQLTYMNDAMGCHSIENTTDETAMTLHVYANPIEECRVYDEESEQFEINILEYDSEAIEVGT